MEKKAMKSNYFIKLLAHSLKEKKNWFLLSTIIILVTTLLIPNILHNGEYYIVFGIIEAFIIILINCLVDNSFLHNDSKLAYYKSKPVSINTQIAVNTAVNIFFAGILIALITLSIQLQKTDIDSDIFKTFKVVIPWLLSSILLVSLSSVLTGNTIMAAVMTLFNFALPIIFYLIAMFIFNILENIVIGFSAEILMKYLLNYVYKVDYIYFLIYADKSIDYMYFLILAAIITIISLITVICIKRRKNENTGDFIVFDGYKYFVAVLVSLIIPAFFSSISYENNVTNQIIVSAILAILSYYIIIAMMEKSFKVSKLSIKNFIVCMALFVALAGGSVAYANQYKNLIPDKENVRIAYIGYNEFLFTDKKFNDIIKNCEGEIDCNEDFMNWQNDNNQVVFTEKGNIENITKLHKEILSNQSYNFKDQFDNDLVFAYLTNDGSVIIRKYRIYNNAAVASNNKIKDNLANKIISSSEMKTRKYNYLYNKKHSNKLYYHVGNITDDNSVNDYIKIDDIRDFLIKDIDKIYSGAYNSFESIFSYNNDYSFNKDEKLNNFYIEIIERRNIEGKISDYVIDRIILNRNFSNTLEYLKLK